MANDEPARVTAAPPPPPPPVPSPPAHHAAPVARAGQLTVGWRAATAIVWGFVLVGFVAVWKTSRELGLNTWWLGPWGEPQPPYVTMLPFVAPITMIVLAVNGNRRLPQIGLVAAGVTALFGLFDIARVPRLAAVELAIAGAGALTAAAVFGGRYRSVPAPVASPGDD